MIHSGRMELDKQHTGEGKSGACLTEPLFSVGCKMARVSSTTFAAIAVCTTRIYTPIDKYYNKKQETRQNKPKQNTLNNKHPIVITYKLSSKEGNSSSSSNRVNIEIHNIKTPPFSPVPSSL